MSKNKGKPGGKYVETRTSAGRKRDYHRSGWSEDAPRQRVAYVAGRPAGKPRPSPRLAISRLGRGRNRKAALPLLSMSAEQAARKILKACRRGAPRLALGVKTRAAILFNELFPGLTASVMATVNRALPSADLEGDTRSHSGSESESLFAPSLLTGLSERAAARNNEKNAM
jgi:hypothetical protein